MKSRFLNSMLATVAVVVGLGVSTAQAQDAKLIDLKEPIIQAQQTPDIKAAGVKDKRWKPKEWLEFEVPFIAMAPRNAKANFTSYEQLTFKFYIFLSNADKEKSRILTAEVNHVNVPVGEGMASVVYLSPSAVLGLSGSPRVQTNAVSGDFSPRNALDLLVARTPLVVSRDATTGALAVKKGAADPNAPLPLSELQF